LLYIDLDAIDTKYLMKIVNSNIFILGMVSICMATVVINMLSSNKADFLFEKGTKYLKIDDQYVALSGHESLITLDFSFIDWQNINEIELLSSTEPKGVSLDIDKLEVFAQGKTGQANFATEYPNQHFWQKISAHCGSDANLFLKIYASDKQKYYAALKSYPNSPTYISGLMSSTFLENSAFHINTHQQNALYQEDYELGTSSPEESIIPYFLGNQELSHGQKIVFENNTSNNDSVFALVKTEAGTVYKQCFENKLALDLSKILEQHIESSTIFFCIGDPMAPDRRLAILNVSNDNVLHAVQSDLLFKTIGLRVDQIKTPFVSYKKEDLDFVWGDMQFVFNKNESGDYFAKKRIGRSKWNSSSLSNPNLVFGKNLVMDSLTFDFSVASQDMDITNKIRLRDINMEDPSKDISSIIPDSLTSFLNSNEDRTIRLDSIKNEQIGKANISLEIEVFDDRPKIKQKKFQFHWGDIDTTLIQERQEGDYTRSLKLSLAKFQSTFKKEPVLTSSKSGVVDSFECTISHYRENNLLSNTVVTSNLRNAKTFSNSIKKLKSLSDAQAGDKISLSSFKSSQLKENENLRIEIVLEENSVDDIALSVDGKNLFLEWGNLKLKATPLGDSQPKKRIRDQVVEKRKLEQIILKESFLNKYGIKERIIHAEWFLNDNIFNSNMCKAKNWRACFVQQIDQSNPGDFVSLFMRTSSGAGVIVQFYVDHIKSDALIGYGNTQFDSLLFKYSKYEVSKMTLPKYQYEFSWGTSVVPLELVGNPRVYGGKINIKKEDLKKILRNKIDINSSDGEVISINHAYLILKRVRSDKRPKKFYSYDFNCEKKDCAFTSQEMLKVLEDLEGPVYSVGVFVDQHVSTEEGIKVSYIEFIIEDDSSAWVPKKSISSYYPTDLFEFQFVYQNKEKTLIKFDQENKKYKWIFDKYKNDNSVELLDMPGFKTTQRAIYTKYDFGEDNIIRNTQVLSRNYTNVFTLYEYYDLAFKKIDLYWKGYPSLRGSESYCKDDFVCAEGGLELVIDKHNINIIRADLVILPEDGTGYKFVFDDIDSDEIRQVIADLSSHTSLFFENMLIEGHDGEALRLPIKFAYHLE